MKAKIGFVSLGCPKNEVDCERMLARVYQAGYEIVPEDTQADVVVVNTCAFIESAKKESIENILDLAWLKTHGNLRGIVVTGCLAERYFDQIRKDLPEVDAALSVGCGDQIVSAIEKVLSGEKCFLKNAVENLPLSGDRVMTHENFAYLKIAEGCDNRCTYCAIPSIRGAFRSRPMEEILEEAKTLCDLGVKEICLVAQDTTRYGLDLYGRLALAELCEKLCRADLPFRWLRLMYCYPDKITDELVAVMQKEEKICRYIDLPVQHISESVLNKMNRHGGSEAIRSAIARLRLAMPDIAIRTTALVGFPGETKKDFEELRQFVRETKFRHLGAFAYSREEGTPAYGFPSRLPKKEKEARAESLMQAQFEIAAAFNASLVGKTLTVLTEGFDPVSGRFFGRTEELAPEIDGEVWFTAKKNISPGAFVRVMITDSLDYDVIGEAL